MKMVTGKKSLKDIHTVKIREFINRKKRATKSEMVRETGLSFPTITRIVDSLCETGELEDLGQGDSTGGRPSSVYGLNVSFSLFLLIQIEGREISWCVMNLAEQMLDDGKIELIGDLVETLDELICKKEQEYPALRAISIGIAGMVTDGTVVESFAYAELKGLNLPIHFKNLTDLPVEVHNDMDLIALGRWFQIKEKPISSVAIYLGKCGFGAGIILRGEVWRGNGGFAGELGFLPFLEQGTSCIKHGFSAMDVVEYYTRLIQIYAVILNPEQIVLYQNPFIKGRMDEIRQSCCRCIPEKGMPNIELSDDYETDYKKGLYAAAKNLKEG